MRVEPLYKQLPVWTVQGLTLKLQTWRFSCGALDPSAAEYIFRDLPPLDIVFTADPTFDKFATLYIVPMATDGDNYWLTEWSSDPALAQTSNRPDEKWTADISVVPCLNITIKVGATTLEVTANEFDPGPYNPPVNPEVDLRRDVMYKGLHVMAFLVGTAPAEWKSLSDLPMDAPERALLFGDVPVSLGRLEPGEEWRVLPVSG